MPVDLAAYEAAKATQPEFYRAGDSMLYGVRRSAAALRPPTGSALRPPAALVAPVASAAAARAARRATSACRAPAAPRPNARDGM